MARPESPQGDDVSTARPAAAALFTDPRDEAAAGSGALPAPVVILLVLILTLVGGRVALRRRGQRVRREVHSRRETEWKAALRQIQMAQASGAPARRGRQRIEVGSDIAPLKVRTGRPAGPSRTRRKPVRAS